MFSTKQKSEYLAQQAFTLLETKRREIIAAILEENRIEFIDVVAQDTEVLLDLNRGNWNPNNITFIQKELVKRDQKYETQKNLTEKQIRCWCGTLLLLARVHETTKQEQKVITETRRKALQTALLLDPQKRKNSLLLLLARGCAAIAHFQSDEAEKFKEQTEALKSLSSHLTELEDYDYAARIFEFVFEHTQSTEAIEAAYAIVKDVNMVTDGWQKRYAVLTMELTTHYLESNIKSNEVPALVSEMLAMPEALGFVAKFAVFSEITSSLKGCLPPQAAVEKLMSRHSFQPHAKIFFAYKYLYGKKPEEYYGETFALYSPKESLEELLADASNLVMLHRHAWNILGETDLRMAAIAHLAFQLYLKAAQIQQNRFRDMKVPVVLRAGELQSWIHPCFDLTDISYIMRMHFFFSEKSVSKALREKLLDEILFIFDQVRARLSKVDVDEYYFLLSEKDYFVCRKENFSQLVFYEEHQSLLREMEVARFQRGEKEKQATSEAEK